MKELLIKIGRWREVLRTGSGNVIISDTESQEGHVVIERADIPDLIRALVKMQDPAHNPVKILEGV